MNVDQCISAFVRGEGRGSSGGVSFGGGVLWSYAMEIAWRRNGKIFQVSPAESVSPTTDRHIRKLSAHTTVPLPIDSVMHRLKVDQHDFVDGDYLRGHGQFDKCADWWKLERAGEIDTYLLCAPIALFLVPHYHQLPAKETRVWMRTLTQPHRVHLDNLWRFMLLNPAGKRPQARLKKAFQEGRLAQYGTCLVERRPDETIPAKHLWSAGGVVHPGKIGLDGVTMNITTCDNRDCRRYTGTLNRRRTAPKGVVSYLHTDIVPLLSYTEYNAPVSLWERDMAMLGRLKCN